MKHILLAEMQSCPKIIVYEEDIISIDTQESIAFDLDESMVSSAIKHRTPGIHIWKAKIIGETQQFIHLLDNTGRVWVDITGLQTDFQHHDYVEIEVMVRGQYIKARKMKKICS